MAGSGRLTDTSQTWRRGIVYLDEQILTLLAKERRDELARDAERRRSLHAARRRRLPLRSELGRLLIRLGGWLMAEPRIGSA